MVDENTQIGAEALDAADADRIARQQQLAGLPALLDLGLARKQQAADQARLRAALDTLGGDAA